MIITLPTDIELALAEQAHRQGTNPETLALDSLRGMFIPKPAPQMIALREPRDEWERLLRSAASDAGVALTDEQLSREVMYEDHD